MKNEGSLNELKEKLSEKMLRTSSAILHQIYQKCVKENKFTYPEIVAVTSGKTPIDTLTEAQLYWLLEYAGKLIGGLGKAEDYFTESEILSHKFYETESSRPVEYPIVFSNVICLTPSAASDSRQFGFYMTVEDIAKYKANGILQVVPELQRNGRTDRYGDLKIKVNPRRRKEITEVIERGEYFYNSISICLVEDETAEWEYERSKGRITIKKGNLIIPDGNHRAVACEFVEKGNIHGKDMFHVLFSVLPPQEIKRKISQEWNTEPVNKAHQKSMQGTAANQIVDAMRRSPDMDETLRKGIVTTKVQITYGEGLILYSMLSGAIEKRYETKSITTKQEQNEITSWLTEFLNYVVYLFKDDFADVKRRRKTKWNVSPYAFMGYVMLSRHLRSRAKWKDELGEILSKIDFANMEEFRKNKADKAYIRYVEEVVGEAIADGGKQEQANV